MQIKSIMIHEVVYQNAEVAGTEVYARHVRRTLS